MKTFKKAATLLIALGGLFTANLQAAYQKPSHIDSESWERLTPYFLPYDTTEREELDKIFSKRRVLNSKKAMRKADFLLISPSEKIIVARHHKLRGYLIKTYLDGQQIDESYWWRKRIDGANLIRQQILAHGYEGFMKVPHKWIYPLPENHAPKDGKARRNYILVVEDVRPRNQQKNREFYKKAMTEEKLIALFVMITENKLIDSVYPDNTPFCHDNMIAFLDTEHSMDWTRPPPLSVIGNFLSKEMLAFWEQLLVNGVPQ